MAIGRLNEFSAWKEVRVDLLSQLEGQSQKGEGGLGMAGGRVQWTRLRAARRDCCNDGAILALVEDVLGVDEDRRSEVIVSAVMMAGIHCRYGLISLSSHVIDEG